MAKQVTKPKRKACTHPIKIYEEALLPQLKWRCVKCNMGGSTAEGDIKYLHTPEQLKVALLENEV